MGPETLLVLIKYSGCSDGEVKGGIITGRTCIIGRICCIIEILPGVQGNRCERGGPGRSLDSSGYGTGTGLVLEKDISKIIVPLFLYPDPAVQLGAAHGGTPSCTDCPPVSARVRSGEKGCGSKADGRLAFGVGGKSSVVIHNGMASVAADVPAAVNLAAGTAHGNTVGPAQVHGPGAGKVDGPDIPVLVYRYGNTVVNGLAGTGIVVQGVGIVPDGAFTDAAAGNGCVVLGLE